MVAHWRRSRQRTLELLQRIEGEADPVAVLGWRPGRGRAHIGWQLMHLAITEEKAATQWFGSGREMAWPDLLPRFGYGSVPDDDIPTPALLREVLSGSRSHLEQVVSTWSPDRLQEVPAALAERGWTLQMALSALAWHEPHHQGQAHITYNLWKAQQAG
ncbi:MAG: DinB family protein [Phycisphaerae bacterium]